MKMDGLAPSVEGAGRPSEFLKTLLQRANV